MVYDSASSSTTSSSTRASPTPPSGSAPPHGYTDRVHDWVKGNLSHSPSPPPQSLKGDKQEYDETLPHRCQTCNGCAREREQLYAHYPRTPWGAINFAVDTAMHLSIWGIFCVIVLLPLTLLYTLVWAVVGTVGWNIAAAWNAISAYPTDLAVQRARAFRKVVRLAILPLLSAPLCVSVEVCQGAGWGASLANLSVTAIWGAVIISITPVRLLAALVHGFSNAMSRIWAAIVCHVESNEGFYVFIILMTSIAWTSYALYYFINAIGTSISASASAWNEQRRLRDPLLLHNQVMAELAALSARLKELEGMVKA